MATSAVREATNRLAFIDRVYIATGIQVEPIDEAEVNRITYLGVAPFLNAERSLADAHTIVVEVGGGSTEVLIVRNGDVIFSHTYRLGSLRLRQTLRIVRAPAGKVRVDHAEPNPADSRRSCRPASRGRRPGADRAWGATYVTRPLSS